MRGSISEKCPAEILSEVLRRQISGVLSFTHAGVNRQLSIDAGTMIRFAASTDPGENFTAHLSSAARIDADRMRQAMAERRGDEMLGTTLVRLGHLPAGELSRATRAHVRHVALLTMQLREGTWEFSVGALPFREQLDAGVRAAEVILEWSRTLTDLDWVRDRLRPESRSIRRERRPPEGYQEIRLDSAEGFIMSRVDGAANAREIGMVSPMGEARTLAALLGLAWCGLLEPPAGAGQAIDLPEPAAAPAAPPPAAPAHIAPAPAAHVPAVQAPASQAPAKPTSTAAQAPAKPATAPGAPALRLVPPPAGGTKPAPGKLGSRPLRPPGKGIGRPGGARPASALKRPVAAPPPKPVDGGVAELEREMMIRYEQIDSLDLYQSLGVLRGAPTDEVRRAYYALTRRFHPDKFRREEIKPNAEKVFARITEAYATLANVDARQRYDEESAKQSTRGDDRPPDTTDLARLNFRSGREHLERGKLAEALGFFSNACQQDPSKSEYFEMLGATQARNPRLRREAEENLNRAIELMPSGAGPYLHLAALYERAGQADKAIETYRAAIQWEPENRAAAEAIERLAPTKKGLLGLFGKH